MVNAVMVSVATKSTLPSAWASEDAQAFFLGAGLGYRLELTEVWQADPQAQSCIDFIEIAPENWMGMGGWRAKTLRDFTSRYPTLCHGLSLSIGGPQPIDVDFVQQMKAFLDLHNVAVYSEHLSYCADPTGQLYELMPLPFSEEAVQHVAQRVKQVQDILERPLALENVSYYASPQAALTESEFLNAVLTEADCHLLLDVNNIYVNSINNQYDAQVFLDALPAERIAYIHVAGHDRPRDDLCVDTHAETVCQPVWDILAQTYRQYGILPTLLERDDQFEDFPALLGEVNHIRMLQQQASTQKVRYG